MHVDYYFVFMKIHIIIMTSLFTQAYPMTKPVRGKAIIINNEWYENKEHMRSGSSIDRENLETLFSELHFETEAWESRSCEVN